ncbi:MAG: hypothetical protein ACXAAO_05755 [Candidatus Thorarchaeota archaeon]
MIDPSVWLILLAFIFGGVAIFIVFTIIIGQRISSKRADMYTPRLVIRTAAMFFDIIVLSFVFDIIWSLVIPGYISSLHAAIIVFPLNPLASLLGLIFSFVASVFSYLIFYLPIYGAFVFLNLMMPVVIFGFFYFFIFDAFFGGKTVGRRVLGLETLHESKKRTLTKSEASINAIGKVFLLLDLFLGFIASALDSRDPELRQVRLTQRLARAVTKDSYYTMSPDEEKLDSFLGEGDDRGTIWWDDNEESV